MKAPAIAAPKNLRLADNPPRGGVGGARLGFGLPRSLTVGEPLTSPTDASPHVIGDR